MLSIAIRNPTNPEFLRVVRIGCPFESLRWKKVLKGIRRKWTAGFFVSRTEGRFKFFGTCMAWIEDVEKAIRWTDKRNCFSRYPKLFQLEHIKTILNGIGNTRSKSLSGKIGDSKR